MALKDRLGLTVGQSVPRVETSRLIRANKPKPKSKGALELCKNGSWPSSLLKKWTTTLPPRSSWIGNCNARTGRSAALPSLVLMLPGKTPSPKSAQPPVPVLPQPWLDLHLALHLKRRVNPDNQIDFLGRTWPISPTKRSSITLIHHRPHRQFWAVTHPPSAPLNIWPEILGNYTL